MTDTALQSVPDAVDVDVATDESYPARGAVHGFLIVTPIWALMLGLYLMIEAFRH